VDGLVGGEMGQDAGASRLSAGQQLAAEERDALAHAHQAVAAGVTVQGRTGRRIPSTTVVGHLDFEFVGQVTDSQGYWQSLVHPVDSTDRAGTAHRPREGAEALPLGLFQVDTDRRVIYTNDRLHQIIGMGPAENVADQLANIVAADQPLWGQALEAVLDGGHDGDVEVRLQPPGSDHQRLCTMGQRIADAHALDVTIAAGTVGLRASIGVAWTRAVNTDADTLVGQADAAMYESKRQDEGRPVLFHPSLRTSAAGPSSSSVGAVARGSADDEEDAIATAG
jgi:predicted signal transduction protein with EAL and GGDEF domain